MRTHPDRQLIGRTVRSFLGLLTLAAIAGCSKSPPFDPVASDATALGVSAASTAGFGAGTFYPLGVGKQWSYEGESKVTVVGPDGSPVEGGLEIRYTESHALLGTETREGRIYTVREEVRNELTEPYVGTWVTWSRMRQDRSGLFAAAELSDTPPTLDEGVKTATGGASVGRRSLDLSSLRTRGFSEEAIARFAARVERLRGYARSVTSARGAESPDELTWLLYPLRPGLEWNVVPGMEWPARVDRLEVLDTPAGRLQAYRIETNPLGEPMKEGEYVRLWYGRAGFVGYSVHISGAATDPDGNPTGDTAIFDDFMILTATD